MRAHLLQPAEDQSQPVFAGQTAGIKQVRSRFGSSALWIMISATSTTRHAGWNRSRTPSDRKCHLSIQNKPLPM
jgi:hypothetical protein